jgi:hypothetical protein
MNHEPAGGSQPGPGLADSPGPMAPGDEAPPGTQGTGDDICEQCGGSGRANGGQCPNCAGTGKVTRGISGA